jgi:lipopolysaccharide export LptBFGC system permease protein LptF
MIYKTLHRRTDNTMAKRQRTNNDLQNTTQKDRQYNGQNKKNKQWSTKHYTEGQTIQWAKDKGQTMIYKTLHRSRSLFVLCLLAIVLSVLLCNVL